MTRTVIAIQGFAPSGEGTTEGTASFVHVAL